MRWHPDYKTQVFAPTLRFYDNLLIEGRLDDDVVIWRQLGKPVATRDLPGIGEGQIVTRSRRQPPRLDFAGSDSKHRDAAERIAGAVKSTVDDNADALRDPLGRRGCVLIYLAADPAGSGARTCRAYELPDHPDPGDLAVLISMVSPAAATPNGRSVIEWTVRRKEQWGSAVVDRQQQ